MTGRAQRTATVAGLVVLLLGVPTGCRPKPTPRWLPDAQVYRSWAAWPGNPIETVIPGHRATKRLIYVNPTGLQIQVIQTDGRTQENYPEGSIIIKEIYKSNQDLAAGRPDQLTAMVKQSEHPEARAGWVWVTKGPGAGTERVIDYELCVDCHTEANRPHPYGDGNPNGEFRDSVFLPHPDRR